MSEAPPVNSFQVWSVVVGACIGFGIFWGGVVEQPPAVLAGALTGLLMGLFVMTIFGGMDYLRSIHSRKDWVK